MGDTHDIVEGDGREKGDPFMPLLFSLGQQIALAINEHGRISLRTS